MLTFIFKKKKQRYIPNTKADLFEILLRELLSEATDKQKQLCEKKKSLQNIKEWNNAVYLQIAMHFRIMLREIMPRTPYLKNNNILSI